MEYQPTPADRDVMHHPPSAQQLKHVSKMDNRIVRRELACINKMEELVPESFGLAGTSNPLEHTWVSEGPFEH